MKFDANLAWKDAAAAISANRDMLIALGGVFFMLPALVLALAFPFPQVPEGAKSAVIWAAVREYLAAAWPALAVTTLVQAVGTLTVIALLTGEGRPTVGQSIARGFRDLLPYLGAQLLVGAGLGLVFGLLRVIAGPAIALVIGFLLLVFVFVRTGLIGPAVTIDGRRNPMAILRRSFDLTKGKFWQLLGFALLIAIAALVLIQLITIVFGLIFALFGTTVAAFGNAVVSAATGAAVGVLSAGLVVAVYRQLATAEPVG